MCTTWIEFRTQLPTVCCHQLGTVYQGSPVSTQLSSSDNLQSIYCFVYSMEICYRVGWPAPLLGSVELELWWLLGTLILFGISWWLTSPAWFGNGTSSMNPVDLSLRMENSKEDRDTHFKESAITGLAKLFILNIKLIAVLIK